MVFFGVEATAQTVLGQAILKLADRLLWIVEKSAQWSLPTQELTSEENGKSFGKIELVRPLPWILFLPSLLMLRLLRFGINITAGFLGYPKMQPADMVRSIQRGRRRIRAVKSSGLKSIRMRKSQASKVPHLTEERATTEPSVSPSQMDHKRKFSEVSSNDDSESESDEEPLLAKIDRLANQSGTDDSYVPSVTEEDESSDSELDMSISMSEVQEVQQEGCKVANENCRSDTEKMGILCDDKQHTTSEDLESCAKKVHLLTLTPGLEESRRQYGHDRDATANGVTEDELTNVGKDSTDTGNGENPNHEDKSGNHHPGGEMPNGQTKGKNKNPPHNSNTKKHPRRRRNHFSREKN